MRRYVLRSAASPPQPSRAAIEGQESPKGPSNTASGIDDLLADALQKRKRKDSDDPRARVASPPSKSPSEPIVIDETAPATPTQPGQPVHPFFMRKSKKAASAPPDNTRMSAPSLPMQLSMPGTALPGQPVHSFFALRAVPAATLAPRVPVQHINPLPIFTHVTQLSDVTTTRQNNVCTLELVPEEELMTPSLSIHVARASLLPMLFEEELHTAEPPPLIHTSSPSLLFSQGSEDALFEQILQLASGASLNREAAKALLGQFKHALPTRGSDLLLDALRPTRVCSIDLFTPFLIALLQASQVIGAPPIEEGMSVLCTGPVGSGKSSLVAALSGAKALEISACQPRDRAAVLRSVEEATQSLAVGSEKCLESGTALVFEEVDLVFDSDKGFHSAVSSLLASSKVPIYLTCNSDCPPSLRLPSHVKVVHLSRPSPSDVILYGLLAWLAMGAPANIDAAHRAVIHASRTGDYRAALTALSLPLMPILSPHPIPSLPADLPTALSTTPTVAPAVVLSTLSCLCDSTCALDVLTARIDNAVNSFSTSVFSLPTFYHSATFPFALDASLSDDVTSMLEFYALRVIPAISTLPRRVASRWRNDAADLKRLIISVSGTGTDLVGQQCALASICHSEALRRIAAARRRFLHYLHRSASAQDVSALEHRLLWSHLPPSLLPPLSPEPAASGPSDVEMRNSDEATLRKKPDAEGTGVMEQPNEVPKLENKDNDGSPKKESPEQMRSPGLVLTLSTVSGNEDTVPATVKPPE